MRFNEKNKILEKIYKACVENYSLNQDMAFLNIKLQNSLDDMCKLSAMYIKDPKTGEYNTDTKIIKEILDDSANLVNNHKKENRHFGDDTKQKNRRARYRYLKHECPSVITRDPNKIEYI